MKVLVACECSQVVLAAFLKKGHDVYSCDIQECYGPYPERHIVGDVLNYLDNDWDLIIAHPPCTYLTRAGAQLMFPKGELNHERYIQMLSAKEFFMKIYNCNCPKICIENPVPMKICGLPVPNDMICPSEFGHDYTKKTYLWLKGLPPLMPTCLVDTKISYVYKFPFADGNMRSRFHEGIAAAMAEQWG